MNSRGYFNSKNQDYIKIAGIWIWRGFTIVQKYTRFLEFSQTEPNSNRGNFEIKGVSLLFKIFYYFWNSKNRKYFRTAGILLQGSFKFLPETVCIQGAESDGGSFIQTPPTRIPDFWNSRNLDYSRTAGMSSRGSFKPLGETVCTQGAESIWRRVTGLKNSRGYQIPKIWTILESREF